MVISNYTQSRAGKCVTLVHALQYKSAGTQFVEMSRMGGCLNVNNGEHWPVDIGRSVVFVFISKTIVLFNLVLLIPISVEADKRTHSCN